jgi:hypothetical protein
MYRAFTRIIVFAMLLGGGFYAWQHYRSTPSKADDDVVSAQSESKDPLKEPVVKYAGPLADYVSDSTPSSSSSLTPDEEKTPVRGKPSPKDHIEDSPVGTSGTIIRKTFALSRVIDVPFEIPPHAIMPRFHGRLQSLERKGGEATHDESANVDMLLMNEKQYAEFAAGRDAEVLLIADTSHYRDIDFVLSPSGEQPVRYHLVFRNPPGGAARKLVKADFGVDF